MSMNFLPIRKFSRWLALVALPPLLLCACYKAPKGKTREEVIQEKIAERLTQWEIAWRRSCYEKALEKAAAIVDSTILAQARASRDTTLRSLIPPRPGKPEVEMPFDTTPLRPILPPLPDTSQKESGGEH